MSDYKIEKRDGYQVIVGGEHDGLPFAPTDDVAALLAPIKTEEPDSVDKFATHRGLTADEMRKKFSGAENRAVAEALGIDTKNSNGSKTEKVLTVEIYEALSK